MCGDDMLTRAYDDPGKTMMVVGRSYSGKTHFLVEEMNKLANETREVAQGVQRPIYDAILFFTESVDADPLRELDPSLKSNIILVRSYIPKIVQLLKKIQDASKRHFRFLVITDDIVNGIRQGMIVKQVLTMRNSQISTCMLLQFVKLISPSMRNSIHEMYVTGLKPEEWEYLLGSFLSSHAVKLMSLKKRPTTKDLAFAFHEWLGSNILVYNQRTDEASVIKRREWRK